jgi:parvulin-like peptidyl-prolyl isomerase
MLAAACGGTAPGGTDPNEVAATVNGKNIRMEEVERAIKQQSSGQELNLSPLELAAARLQALQALIEQEVMFQKAEKEGTVPTDEEVTAELNRVKTQSGLSAEQFAAQLQQSGETEETIRQSIKKRLAIDKLAEKITGRIEPPKDNEIEAFYNSNKEAFKNKRGAQLAAIVIDPRDLGQGDTTKNDLEAQAKAREIGIRLVNNRADFATLAQENSEDPETRARGGDWRYFTEDELKQAFPQAIADYIMNKMEIGTIIPQVVPFQGRYLIIKLQKRIEKDEDRTLESPGVRQEITEYLINSRKQLLVASYQSIAMNEARIENYLAKRVVENPNELSGARPAPTAANTSANSNSNSNSGANTSSNSNNNSSENSSLQNSNRTANAPANVSNQSSGNKAGNKADNSKSSESSANNKK